MNHYIPIQPESYYHVFNRANAWEILFNNHENFVFFLKTCEKYLPEVCVLHAYCLIPNHFHFVIWTRPETEIELHPGQSYSTKVSKVFSNLFNSYTRSYNVYYQRRGLLFSRSFKRSHLHSLSYLKTAVLYVHHNAVHHKLCTEPEEWPYTSHRKIISDPVHESCTKLLSWFGGLDGYLTASRKYNSFLNNNNFPES